MKILRNSQAQLKFCVSYIKKECRKGNIYNTLLYRSLLRLRQKVKRDKLAALYRYLHGTGDLDLINLDQFHYTKNTKNGTTNLQLYDYDKRVPLRKQTGEFLAPKH